MGCWCSYVTSVVNGADVVPMFSQGALDDLRDEIVTSEWFDDLCSIEPQCFSMAQYVGGSLSKVHLRPASPALIPGGNPYVRVRLQWAT